jgi:glycosyltransferase involved in cell wall biosynthesis
MAASIRAVLASEEMAQQLAKNGKKRVAEEFSEPAIVGQYLSLMEGLAASRRAG